jgi:hypothetical protein
VDDGLTVEHRVEFHEDPPIVAVITSGTADPAGWELFHDELLADPRVEGRSLLIDHSELDVSSLSADAVRTIGRSVKSLSERLAPVRRAVVVTGGFRYGLARMARAELGPETEKMVQVFTSRSEALAWLRSDSDAPP